MATKVDNATLAIYTRQLALMFRCGIPLQTCLHSLSKGEHEGLNRAFAETSLRVTQGVYLSTALARFPEYFPPYYLGLLQVGESTGTVHVLLERVAEYLENNADLEKRVRSALVYPVVLVIVSGALLTFLLAYILPIMRPMFDTAGVELPWLTRFCLSCAEGLRRLDVWAVIAFGMTVAALGIRQVMAAEPHSPLRRTRDRIVLELPLIGKVVSWATIAQLLRLMALMLAAGIDIRAVLRSLRATLSNQDFQDALGLVEECLTQGGTLAQGLHRSPLFPLGCVAMVRVAEETGCLTKMLETIAGLYEENAELATMTMLELLEPLLLCGASLVVGTVCIAALLPWMQLLSRML